MPSILQSPWYQKAVIGLVVLLSPIVAFLLIGGAESADFGLTGWIVIVLVPLALLGLGLYLIARGSSGSGSEPSASE